MAVSVEKQGAVARVTFNRPPANSYNREFLDELNAAIDEIRFDEELRVAVVASELPKFFCAGADIKMFQERSLPYKNAFVLHAHEVCGKLERTPKVFIAALAGHALGGGLELALACDFRFAADGEYRIGLPESKLGLLPGTGGTQRLPRLIGMSRAIDLMVTGEGVPPERALELGIVDKVFADDELMPKTMEYAEKLASGPSLAVGAVKLAAQQGGAAPLEYGNLIEREILRRIFETKDAAEGMGAFAEKRKPTWQGQ